VSSAVTTSLQSAAGQVYPEAVGRQSSVKKRPSKQKAGGSAHVCAQVASDVEPKQMIQQLATWQVEVS
jgi:hypothetical protein